MATYAEAQPTLFQLTGVGVVRLAHPTGHFTQVNSAFCDMVGYSEADLQKLSFHELTHPDERGGEGSIRRYVRRGGSVVWLELHVTPFTEGDPYRIAVVHDVTERKQVEKALQDSEAKYRTLFGSISDGFAIAEMLYDDAGRPTDYRFLEVCPQFEKLTGFAQVTGKTAKAFVPTLEPELLETFHSAASERKPVRARTRTGFLKGWFDVHAFPYGAPEDRLFAAVFTNVTERERAEAELRGLNASLERRVEEQTEALHHSERRFSQAFQIGPVAACITTLGRETFLEVNDAFLTLTGYTRDEVEGHSSRELGMWSSPEDQRKLGLVQQGEKGFHNVELKLRDKAGAVHDILSSGEVIRLDGHRGYLKMFYDITERKRTEEQMHRAIQEVMSDTSWFSHRVMEQLATIRLGGTPPDAVELSRRERQVLERIAKGENNPQIAEELGVAAQTVRNYITIIYDKLGVHTRAEAVVWARERGIVGP